MNLRIDNQQAHYPLDQSRIEALSRELATLAFRRIPTVCWSHITIILTDSNGIQSYKEAAFGYREVTDVVTLCYAPSPVDPAHEGELFINVERAFTFPKRPGWSAMHELALYIAHGFDHLTGADDDTPTEQKRMRRREQRWLRTPICRNILLALSQDT